MYAAAVESTPSTDVKDFLAVLQSIVGRSHVLTRPGQTRRFRTGYRCGAGNVLAVVRPGNLVEQWRVLKACVDAGKIVIVQAANTGLTGGSTPDGDDYDRDVVLVNTMRMRTLHLVDEGRQVVWGDKIWRGAVMRAVRRRIEGQGNPQALELLADKLVASGLDGDVQALKEIGDRLDRKPTQALTHSGEYGEPITFKVITAYLAITIGPKNSRRRLGSRRFRKGRSGNPVGEQGTRGRCRRDTNAS